MIIFLIMLFFVFRKKRQVRNVTAIFQQHKSPDENSRHFFHLAPHPLTHSPLTPHPLTPHLLTPV
ncbi:MAG TPA: hypothetical protein PK198_18990, partial [Saprospiraceae bacterium]|nr:hypothetical protein [Saprospiraceae bacterium]